MRDRNARIATLSKGAAAVKVEDALRKGYITPAMRGWATALCTQDPDSFDGFIAKSTPATAHLTKPSHTTAAPPGKVATGCCDDSDAATAIPGAAWPARRQSEYLTSGRALQPRT